MNSRLPSGPGLSSFFSIERVVTVLTPTVFAPLAVWLSALIASNVPLAPHPSAATLTGIEISAFLGAVAIAIKWLHGRQIPAIAGVPIQVPPAVLDQFYAQVEAYLQAHPDALAAAQRAATPVV